VPFQLTIANLSKKSRQAFLCVKLLNFSQKQLERFSQKQLERD